MSRLRYSTAISLDGFIAGPDQSFENPIGVGGMQLHEWVFELAAWRSPHGQEGGVTNASSPVVEDNHKNIGAVIMGRNMFGGGPDPWAEPAWDGWWGDEPPFHAPVFVLTHHEREPLELTGTTFTFVTGGLEQALEPRLRGGRRPGRRDRGRRQRGAAVRRGGLLDEVTLTLRRAARLRRAALRGRADGRLRAGSRWEAPGVTHLTYRLR